MDQQSKDSLMSLIITFYYMFVGALSIFVYLDIQNILSPYSSTPPIFYQSLLFILFLITTYSIFRIISTGKVYGLIGRGGRGATGVLLRDTNRTGFYMLLGIRIFVALLVILAIFVTYSPPAPSPAEQQTRALEDQLMQQVSKPIETNPALQ